MAIVKQDTEEKSSRPRILNDYEEVSELQKTKAKLREDVTLHMLATMVEAVSEQLEELREDKKDFYDKELGAKLVTSLDKVSTTFSEISKNQPKLDLTPIARINESTSREHQRTIESILTLMRNISDQNVQLIESIKSIANRPDNDSGYESLLRQTMSMIATSNEFIRKGFPVADNSSGLDRLHEAMAQLKPSAPGPWHFEIERMNGNGRISKIIAKPQ